MIRPGTILCALLICMALAVGGCSMFAEQAVKTVGDEVSSIKLRNDLKSHAVRSIKTVEIDRVAVMPLIDAAPDQAEGVAVNGAEAVSAELYSASAVLGGWEVVPQEDVVTEMQKLPPTTPSNMDDNAIKLGHETAADGVIYGTLNRYQERVGADYAASSPASVNFNLKFVDVKSGQVLWTATFVKTQQALADNMFDFANFVQRSGRWVRANEIAQEGVQEAVNDLHGKLNLDRNVKRFETGTYGQLKSGSQRYNFGSNGIY